MYVSIEIVFAVAGTSEEAHQYWTVEEAEEDQFEWDDGAAGL